MREEAPAVPAATVARLPLYLRCLEELEAADVDTVSSGRLADLAGVNAAKLRKDLSHLGSYGTRGVGYEVSHLMHSIRGELGLDEQAPVVILGVGNLGQALANHAGFGDRGFPIVGVFDNDPAKIGTLVAGHRVRSLDDLEQVVAEGSVRTAIVATPADAAQPVTDRAISAGVTSVLNFAPTVVQVSDGIALRQVDLALELQILSYYRSRDASSERDENYRLSG